MFFSGKDWPKIDSLLSFFTNNSCRALCFSGIPEIFNGDEDWNNDELELLWLPGESADVGVFGL